MTGKELFKLLDNACRRPHLIGTLQNGIIAALSLEGRLFAVVGGEVISRAVPLAILSHPGGGFYRNPGGDALWPAPEGTTLGYEYTTGSWRVPPSIANARWEVLSSTGSGAVIAADIDLINNQQMGFPCQFRREITVETVGNVLIQRATETIRYTGTKTITKGDFLLVPWSLCQFDSGPSSNVLIPICNDADIWDMYDSSEQQRSVSSDGIVVKTATPRRFQLALSETVEWVKYVVEGKFSVKRCVVAPPVVQPYIDIADAPPHQIPSDRGVKLSVYCDPSGFMEIEGCGTSPDLLTPGREISVQIITEYTLLNQRPR